MEIVKVHNGEPRVGTFFVAQGFRRDHKKIVQLITKYHDRFLRFEDNKSVSKRLIIQKVPSKKAGRPAEEYLLNEKQAVFLGTLFRNNEIVLDFKEKLANDFVEVRNALRSLSKHKEKDTYQITRNASKIIRRETTDVMKVFIDYAKGQGSTNAEKYYANITRMANGMLFIIEGKFKNLREVMSVRQLMTVGSADQIIDTGLKYGMSRKMFYKEIYQEVKKRVMTFAELHGKSHIIDQCLALDAGDDSKYLDFL